MTQAPERETAAAADAPPTRRTAGARRRVAGRASRRRSRARDVRGRGRPVRRPRATGATWSSFTWNLKTVEGREEVADLVGDTARRGPTPRPSPPRSPPTRPTAWSRRGSPSRPPSAAAAACCAWSRRTARTGRSRCSRRSTSSRATRSRAAPTARWAPSTAPNKQRRTWKEKRQDEAESLGSTTQPYVLVIGGGQGGIALGSRLRQLGVPALVIDKHPRPGDQWRSRYKSLCLHDPVWYDHLPYLKFPDNWPVFSPKDKIGDWLESYTKIMEVPYWSSTTATSATWSEEARGVDRRGRARGQAADAAPEAARLRHRHVGQAQHPRGTRRRRLQGRPAPLLGAPGTGRLPRQEGRGHRQQQLQPSTSAARCGRTTSTSRWCSAPRPTSSRATA